MKRLSRNDLRELISESLVTYLKRAEKTSAFNSVGQKQLNELLTGDNPYTWIRNVDYDVFEDGDVVESVEYVFTTDSKREFSISFTHYLDYEYKDSIESPGSQAYNHYSLVFGPKVGGGYVETEELTGDYDLRLLNTVIAATRDFVAISNQSYVKLKLNETLPNNPLIISYEPTGGSEGKRAKVYARLLGRHLRDYSATVSHLKLGGLFAYVIFIPTS
tara:strand:- start:28 stop:681 length:654 start_codon:yes stop_codon:yes gene_type:complete